MTNRSALATALSVVALLTLVATPLLISSANAGDKPAAAPAPQEPIRLWTGAAPGATGEQPTDIPTITPFIVPAEKASGAAVVVCPGGGYGGLADHEGKPIAEWLNSIGVHSFVLRYRLGSNGYRHPVMKNDVLRGIRTVRARAKEWGIDPTRIGVLGFSAGGHLASTAATHFDEGDANAADEIDRASARPDVAVLVYPVITMTDPHTHAGSRANLLGQNPSAELIDLMSNEKRVTPRTPPCFLSHAVDDGPVPPQNSLMFAEALTKHRVPFALHMLEKGGHGYGLGASDPILNSWTKVCTEWLRSRGFVKAPGAGH